MQRAPRGMNTELIVTSVLAAQPGALSPSVFCGMVFNPCKYMIACLKAEDLARCLSSMFAPHLGRRGAVLAG